MHRLMNLALSGAEYLPLRPLLYTAGAAAAAAGVYYYIRKRGDGERTAETAYTTITEAQTQLPSVDSLPDPGLMSDVNGVSVKQTESTVLQSDIMAQVNTLRGSVQQLEEKLSQTRRIFHKIRRQREREKEEHSILKSKYNEMRVTLPQRNELLKATLAEAVATYEQLLESNTQLEKEKADLMYHVHKLRGRVQQLEEMLYEADITRGVIKQHLECAGEAYSILNSQYKQTLKQHDHLPMRSSDATKGSAPWLSPNEAEPTPGTWKTSSAAVTAHG